MEIMDIERAFWQHRRVWVTGHTGFKGSWLCLWLRKLGAEVSGYALEPEAGGSLFEDARVVDGMHSVIGDVRERDALEAAVREAKPEIVFHLAAQPLVRLSYEQPLDTFSVNVMGVAHVLETLRCVGGVRAAVVITTDKVYENREQQRGYVEDDRLGGHDPYAASKACAELVAASYRRSFADCPPVATARAGNVIGGGDRARDRLLTDIVRAFDRHEKPLIRNPQAVRPWQHVLDPLFGYLLLARHLTQQPEAFGMGWNFGPDHSSHVTVRDLVEKVRALWGSDATWKTAPGGHPHETGYLFLDSARARDAMDWRPRWNVDSALEKTVAWWKARNAGADMRVITLDQISAYEHEWEKL